MICVRVIIFYVLYRYCVVYLMLRYIRNCIFFYNFWNVSNNNFMLYILIIMKKFNYLKKKKIFICLVCLR